MKYLLSISILTIITIYTPDAKIVVDTTTKNITSGITIHTYVPTGNKIIDYLK